MAISGRSSKASSGKGVNRNGSAFSFKQRVNHRKFKMNGAIGFADGGMGSAVNRLETLIELLPPDDKSVHNITWIIYTLRTLRGTLKDIRLDVCNRAYIAQCLEDINSSKVKEDE